MIHLIGLGDSLTYGYPYSPAQSWLNRSAQELGITCSNKGINGDLTEEMRLRFPRDVLTGQGSHLILFGGTNDAYNGFAAMEVAEHLEWMGNQAEHAGLVTFLALPIPCGDHPTEALLCEYRDLFRELAERNSWPVLDFYTPFLERGDRFLQELFEDMAHPNRAGYDLMTQVAVRFLRAVLPLN